MVNLLNKEKCHLFSHIHSTMIKGNEIKEERYKAEKKNWKKKGNRNYHLKNHKETHKKFIIPKAINCPAEKKVIPETKMMMQKSLP